MSRNNSTSAEVSFGTVGAFWAVGDGSSVLRLHGELDMAAVPELRTHVDGMVDDVELDCAGLRFIDAAAVQLFLDIQRCCVSRGAKLTLLNPPRCVTRVLAVTGVDTALAVRQERSIR